MDHFQYAIDVSEHVVVPETQDDESSFFQRSSACRIVLDRIGMLAAVEFDDYATFEANEIEDVVAVRMLATKLAAIELSVFQSLPQRAFCIGRVVA